jgi:hypothetical protein
LNFFITFLETDNLSTSTPAHAIRRTLDFENNGTVESGNRLKHTKINDDFPFIDNQLNQMVRSSLTPAGSKVFGQHICHGVSLIFQHLRPGINNGKILFGIMVKKITPMQRQDGVFEIPDWTGGRRVPRHRGKAALQESDAALPGDFFMKGFGIPASP